MNEEMQEFDLEQVLSLINGIAGTLTNIKVNILEIQTQNQQVIIESLKQR